MSWRTCKVITWMWQESGSWECSRIQVKACMDSPGSRSITPIATAQCEDVFASRLFVLNSMGWMILAAQGSSSVGCTVQSTCHGDLGTDYIHRTCMPSWAGWLTPSLNWAASILITRNQKASFWIVCFYACIWIGKLMLLFSWLLLHIELMLLPILRQCWWRYLSVSLQKFNSVKPRRRIILSRIHVKFL